MLKIRKSEERGYADHGWLKSYHTFSFAGYYDPEHLGFRDLRVINQDFVLGGMGFDPHPHNNMEIISYVLSGSLAHKDSMGNSSVIVPGDVQRMSAGTGVIHSEFNNHSTEAVRFLQIWIKPELRDIPPTYAQKNFDRQEKLNNLRLIASNTGKDGSISLNQDVNLYASVLERGKVLDFAISEHRGVWLQLITGQLKINEEIELEAGDALSLLSEKNLKIMANEEAEFLLFDLK